MLTLSQVSKSYGGRVLFENVSLQVNRGEKIGLVGPNGAGKSTLFSLILNENSPDSGKVILERRATVGFLPQESAAVGEETVLELATSHLNNDEEENYDHDFTEIPKAKRILSGLAFKEEDFDKPARTFSGGWIMRAHLARLLVQEPDLLLLDEPTNHLDLLSLRWFQNYLRNYSGAILMISHDREFLNTLAGHIVEIASARLNRYAGNFDFYLRERQARREQQQAAHDAQKREIEHLQRFVDRFRAKANLASQAQSKLKQIARMEIIQAPEQEASTIHFKFPQPSRSGHKVIELKNVTQAYGEHVVYRDLNLTVEREERIVLIGPNGAGKSTLLKLLAGVIPFQAGERILSPTTKVGYYAQHRVEMLNPKHSVLQEAMDLSGAALSNVSEQMARTILGAFLFRGNDVFKPVGVLSGGEKSRLALVKLLLDPPNLLLMDEPTTHLDMGSIDALINALNQYQGTLVFVSHDVYFIRALSRKVLHIEANRVTPYTGGYDYYLEKTEQQNTDARAALISGKSFEEEPRKKVFKTKEQKRAEAEARAQASKAQKAHATRMQQLETEIAKLEARQKELVRALEDEATYQQPGKAYELNQELAEVIEKIEKRTQEWEAAAALHQS